MYQSTTIVGRLGKDPVMRYLPNGDPVTSFNVATDRTYTKAGQKVKETTWWKATVWGKQAENANTYLHKGQAVLLEGRITVDPKTGCPKMWTGQDGVVHADLELNVNTWRNLSPKEESSHGDGELQVEGLRGRPAIEDDEDPLF